MRTIVLLVTSLLLAGTITRSLPAAEAGKAADGNLAKSEDAAASRVFGHRSEPLRAAIGDLMSTFGTNYPGGKNYLARLDGLEKRRDQVLAAWQRGDEASAKALTQLGRDLQKLEQDALLSNPLLDFDRLLLVRRAYKLPANQAAGNPAAKTKGKKAQARQQNSESYNENVEGEILGLPVNHNSLFSIRRSGYDNEIAVLSPVRPEGRLTTLFKPRDDVYVGEVELDFDARHMLLTMPEDDRWQVFELSADGTGLTRVTPNDEPDVDNYDACYLPDGRVIFCSTANYQAIPCWSGAHNTAGIYLLDRTSGHVRQLTFDQDDDNYPSVLNSGCVIFTRWEYANTPHFFGRLLFTMNPDGTGQREFYGSNSYWPNAMYFARAIPGHPSKVVVIISGHHGDRRMGNLAILDPDRGRDRDRGLVFRMPDNWSQHYDMLNRYPESAIQPLGYDKQREPVVRDRLTSHDWPKFLHPFPLSEHYILVSAKPAPQANWGIYLVDTFGNMTLIREAEGQALLEPIPFKPTPRPPVIPDRVDLAQKDGAVYLVDVYRGPGLVGVPKGKVKKLRVFAYDFGYRGLEGFDKIGIDGPWDVMRILGTVPVAEDGSAAFRVPANTAVTVQPLDEKGRALQQMRSWFTVMPGEVKSCVGCHESQNSGPPAAQYGQSMSALVDITPWHGPPRGFSFEREVQPVLDKYCAGCHDGKQTTIQGRPHPDLRGRQLRPDYKGVLANVPVWYDPAKLPAAYDADAQRATQRKHVAIQFTPAYESLIKYVRRTGPEGDYHLLEPAEYYADTSPLIQLLEQGHHGVELDAEAWDRLVTWIDLNVPCHGTWSEALPIPFNGARRKAELAKKYANLDYNPEAIPTLPPFNATPVTPNEVTVKPGDDHAVGWPFDFFEAHRRQQAAGAQTERTIDLGNGRSLKLVLIPAGEFVMGNARSGSPAEWPQTRVRIERTFWMSAGEISNDQFSLFDPEHDSRFERGQKMNVHLRGYPMNEPPQPVVRVTWQEAVAFCQWLSAKSGLRFTLPTEAQWEYACRAGSDQPMWWGAFTENFSERANMADKTILQFTKWEVNALNQIYNGWMPYVAWVDDGSLLTSPAGRYVANPWGLQDMHGNAAEWTASRYQPYPYDAKDGRENPAADGPRVVRGGSWCDLPQFCTASWRFGYDAWRKVHNVGFRVVCPADEPATRTASK